MFLFSLLLLLELWSKLFVASAAIAVVLVLLNADANVLDRTDVDIAVLLRHWWLIPQLSLQICLKYFTNVRFLDLSQSLKFKLVTYFPGAVRALLALLAKIKGSQPRSQIVGPMEFLWQTTKDIAEARANSGVGGGGDFVDRLNELRADGALTDQQAFAQGIGFFQVIMQQHHALIEGFCFVLYSLLFLIYSGWLRDLFQHTVDADVQPGHPPRGAGAYQAGAGAPAAGLLLLFLLLRRH